ncbi:MAG TPA: GWxTD domain-containing protein, partial [Blastocatellia bacterium]|nr:GWxTD domain-containing protein [Blastocatellia bacterium]
MKSDVCLFKRNVGVVLMLILTVGTIPGVLAQEKPQGKDRNERKKKEELKSVYKNWLDEDVSYIITDEERKAFKALKTDEERDQFIEQFWLRRDP